MNVTLSDHNQRELERVSIAFKISKSTIIEILLSCFFASGEEQKKALERVEALKKLLS